MSAPENPPAFPTKDAKYPENMAHEGMTLRDWFAGQALTGIMACPVQLEISGVHTNREGCAAVAYHLADKMLAERAKQP